jgi:hypothetical protein
VSETAAGSVRAVTISLPGVAVTARLARKVSKGVVVAEVLVVGFSRLAMSEAATITKVAVSRFLESVANTAGAVVVLFSARATNRLLVTVSKLAGVTVRAISGLGELVALADFTGYTWLITVGKAASITVLAFTYTRKK